MPFNIASIASRVVGPILDIVKNRQERKRILEDTEAKLRIASQEDEAELTLKRHEVEALAVQGLKDTWKDEYAVVSILSIFNLIVLGGILAAFGIPQMLEGVSLAVQTLVALEVNVGLLIQVAVFTSLGIYVFRRNF